MLYKTFAILKLSSPVAVVALPFGMGYCFLLCLFPDAIEAYDKMLDFTATSQWGGIEVLFSLNSGVLGWVTVVVAERRLGAARFVLLLMALPWCLASIGGGFALALLYIGSFSDPMWEMLAYSLVSAIGACAVRAYLSNIL